MHFSFTKTQIILQCCYLSRFLDSTSEPFPFAYMWPRNFATLLFWVWCSKDTKSSFLKREELQKQQVYWTLQELIKSNSLDGKERLVFGRTEWKCSEEYLTAAPARQVDILYPFKQNWCSKLIVFQIFWFISGNYKSHYPKTRTINTLEFTLKRDYWTAGGGLQYISQCEISSLVASQPCMYQSNLPALTKLGVKWLS